MDHIQGSSVHYMPATENDQSNFPLLENDDVSMATVLSDEDPISDDLAFSDGEQSANSNAFSTTSQEQKSTQESVEMVDAFGRYIPKHRGVWRGNSDGPFVNYNVLTGEVLPLPKEKAETVELPAELALSAMDMHCRALEGSEEVVRKLFSSNRKKYVYGTKYEVAEGVWTLFWDPKSLSKITTFDIQSAVCAALNSRRTLAFVIGVNTDREEFSKMGGILQEHVYAGSVYRNPTLIKCDGFLYTLNLNRSHLYNDTLKIGKRIRADQRFRINEIFETPIIGCELSPQVKKTTREVFEDCIHTEFVPSLDEGLVKLRFRPVWDEFGCEIPSRFLAEITIRDTVTTLYQLSSSRVYYADGNAVARIKDLTEARNMLLYRRQKKLAEIKNAGQLIRIPCLRSPEERSSFSKKLSTYALIALSGFVLSMTVSFFSSYKFHHRHG